MGRILFNLGLFIFLVAPKLLPFQFAEVVGAVLMVVGLVFMFPRGRE